MWTHGSRIRAGTIAVLLSSGGLVAALASADAAALRAVGPEEVVAGGTLDVYATQRAPALVRVRGNGSAVAAWVAGDHDVDGPVSVALRSPGGTWTAPVALSAPLGARSGYDVAVGPRGLASVVWDRKIGGVWQVEESHLSGAGWTAPAVVDAGRAPHATVDGRGTTTLAWNRAGVRTSRRTEAGSWTAPTRVGPGPGSPLQVASNADGDVVVAWHANDQVRAAVRPHGGGWSAAGMVRGYPARVSVTGVQTAMDPDGRALALWSTTGLWNAPAHEYFNHLGWSRSTAAGAWSPARYLTRSLGEDGGAVSLTMTASGTALAGWVQIHRSDSPAFAWAARFGSTGTWTAPVRVSATRVSWDGPRTWLDPRGVAHLVVGAGDPERIWSFQQRPGRSWDAGTRLTRGAFLDAHGQGRHLVVLYWRAAMLRAMGLTPGA